MKLQERYDNFLMHHGVKGMKWGIRKDRYKKMSQKSKKRHKRFYKNATSSVYTPEMKKERVKEAHQALKRLQKDYEKVSNMTALQFYMDKVFGYGRTEAEAKALLKNKPKNYRDPEQNYVLSELQGAMNYRRGEIKLYSDPSVNNYWDTLVKSGSVDYLIK